MKAVFKHELKQYFDSMTAYVFGAFLLLFIGIGSMLYNLQSAVSNFEFVLSFAAIVFVVIVPVLTMRTLSEERKQKTDQLLYALPISTTQVILGKYAALLLVFLIPLCFVALYPLLFSQFGEVYLPTAYGSLFAFFLLGAAEIGAGLLVSALTESSTVAAVGTFCLLLLVYVWDGLISYLPSTAMGSLIGLFALLIVLCVVLDNLSKNWKVTGGVFAAGAAALIGFYVKSSASFQNLLPNILGTFSPLAAFRRFAEDHVFDLTAVALYLSLIVLELFWTDQVLQKRRWN